MSYVRTPEMRERIRQRVTKQRALSHVSWQKRFWSKVDKTSTCWNWTGAKNKDGYGCFANDDDKSRSTLAHRVSYELVTGVRLGPLDIDHKCHNHACVRPKHLRPATRKQNHENRLGAAKCSLTGYRGVTYSRRDKSYRACVKHNGVRHYLGTFDTPEAAAEAARLKRIELFTHNDIDRIKGGIT